MSPVVRAYFDAVEDRLLESSAILAYHITRQETGAGDGKLRIRAAVQHGGEAEFFMYVAEQAGAVRTLKYSFHWQGGDGTLRRRWDNAPHHPGLPGAPHHVHETDNKVRGVERPPNFFTVIAEMERDLKSMS